MAQTKIMILVVMFGVSLTIPTSFQFPVTIAQDISALHDKGLELFESGDYNGAIEYFDMALEIDPNRIGTLTMKGAAILQLGDYNGAIEYFDMALEIDPKNVGTLENKGTALMRQGDYNGAIEYFDMALEIDPNAQNAAHNRGIACERAADVIAPGNEDGTGSVKSYPSGSCF